MKNLKTNLITNQQTVTMFGKTFSVVTKELNVKKISNSEGKAFAEKLLKDVLKILSMNLEIFILLFLIRLKMKVLFMIKLK